MNSLEDPNRKNPIVLSDRPFVTFQASFTVHDGYSPVAHTIHKKVAIQAGGV